MTSIEKHFPHFTPFESSAHPSQELPDILPHTDADEWDLPPEFCTYKDEGCSLAPSCLNCPFPRCFEDKPLDRQKWSIERRDREIIRKYRRGLKMKRLALHFNISLRTVKRVIREAKIHQRH